MGWSNAAVLLQDWCLCVGPLHVLLPLLLGGTPGLGPGRRLAEVTHQQQSGLWQLAALAKTHLDFFLGRVSYWPHTARTGCSGSLTPGLEGDPSRSKVNHVLLCHHILFDKLIMFFLSDATPSISGDEESRGHEGQQGCLGWRESPPHFWIQRRSLQVSL